MELLIRPAGFVARSVVQPSAFRIEWEPERTLPGLLDVDRVTARDVGYVVTLNISDSQQIADIVRRVQANSTLIGTMELDGESTTAGSRIRVARLMVHVR